MLRKAKKLGAVLMALTMIFVLTISAGAAYFNMPKATDVEGELVGAISDSGFTAKFELFGDKAKSVNFYITSDALNSEFWNNSNAYVEVDLTLNTYAKNSVTAVMPGFADPATWKWVNPSVWNTTLTYGRTVTLREPLSNYYSGGFNNYEPLIIRVQLFNDADEAETVEVTMSAPRIVGLDDAPVATTTTTVATTTTTAPEDTTPEESTPTDTDATVEDDGTVEDPVTDEAGEPADDEPEKTTPASTSTTVKPEESTAATTTQASTTTTAATTKPVSSDDSEAGIAGPVVIIVIVVVVIAGGVVGVIIYRKKKFY